MEEESRIEALKKKLYMTRDESGLPKAHRGVFHTVPSVAKREWDSMQKPLDNGSKIMSKSSFFKKFFIWAFIFFIIAIGFSIFSYFTNNTTVSNKNIDLQVLGNAFTAGGEQLSLEVSAVNRNRVPLELADLILEYPKGKTSNDTTDNVRIRESIGTIPSGATIHHPFNLVLYGEEGSIKNLSVSLEYKIPGSNSLLVKNIPYTVTLSASPIALTVDALPSTSANQPYNLNITILQNSSAIAKNMILKVDYPPGFNFSGASPSPVLGDSVFDLGDIAQGMKKQIKIQGSLNGGNQEEKVFRVYVGEQDDKDQSNVAVVYNSLLQSVTISRPFLDARLTIGGEDKSVYTVSAGNVIHANIDWENSSQSQILNAQVIAVLSGPALDTNTVKVSNGFYDASSNTITWNRDTVPEFATLDPGSRGQFDISFSTLPVSGSGQNISPDINITVNTNGIQQGTNGDNQTLTSIDKKTIHLGSDFSVTNQIRQEDGDTGPNIPHVGQETTYTVRWIINNTTDPAINAVARAVIPSSVTLTNTKGPTDEDISFNPITHELLWKIGTVKKLAVDKVRQIFFQIKINPTSSQIGSPMPLVGNMTLSATDSFSGNTIRITKNALTTADAGGGAVVR